MKNLKKFLALGLVVAMTFSFAACGKDNSSDKKNNESVEDSTDDSKDDSKDNNADDSTDNKDDDKDDNKKVTAEGLLEDISFDEIKSGSVTLTLAADVDMDLEKVMLDEGMTKDDIQDAIDEGTITEDDLFMSLVIEMELAAEATEDYSYTTGKMEMEFAGEEETMNFESYTDSSEEGKTITYTYDETSDSWYYEEEYDEDEEDDQSDFESISEIMDYVKSAEITDEDDDKYTLSVVLDLAKLNESDSEAVEDIMGSVSDTIDDTFGETGDFLESIDEMEFVVEIDKENGYLTAIRLDLEDMLLDLLKELAEADTEEADYSKYISINEFSLEIEFSNFNDVEIEIPKEVIDEAVEGFGDIDLDIDDDDDEVVVTGDAFEIFDYDGNSLATFTIPEGYEIDTEYSDKNWVCLEDDDWNSIEVSCFPSYWVEGLIDGEEYEADLDFYTRDEVFEAESIVTNQGKVRVFIRIWSFDDNSEEEYHQTIVYVLVNEDGLMSAVETDVDEIEGKGYTTESLIQTMLK